MRNKLIMRYLVSKNLSPFFKHCNNRCIFKFKSNLPLYKYFGNEMCKNGKQKWQVNLLDTALMVSILTPSISVDTFLLIF